MKNKVVILIIAVILISVSGISVTYSVNRNDITFNDFYRSIKGTQNSVTQSKSFNSIIKIMKNNG